MTQDPAANRGQAEELTSRIKVALDDLWDLVAKAYTTRAWCALGYESWDEYVVVEFGSNRLALPREGRANTVASLRSAGMSYPAIAAATGLGVGTVHRAATVAAVPTVPNGKVEPVEAAVVIGRNGKRYAPSVPPSPTPAALPTFSSAPARVKPLPAQSPPMRSPNRQAQSAAEMVEVVAETLPTILHGVEDAKALRALVVAGRTVVELAEAALDQLAQDRAPSDQR
ncbi:hypothetical protein [Streptomyces griseus]|uniref:hypothetical protein n=1 Tax=Streptomyces griseus TaxID=1911 RepID=UPI0036789D05